MPKDVTKRDGFYHFTTYMHLSPGKGVRATKTNSGSYANERMCKTVIKVPVSAFTVPDFNIEVSFNSSKDDPDATFAETIQDIDAALEGLPVAVTVIPLPEPETNTPERSEAPQ